MRRMLIAILCTLLWLIVGQVSEQSCDRHTAANPSIVRAAVAESDRDTVCRGNGDMLLPASEPIAVERSGGSVSVRGAVRRISHDLTKIFAPAVADRHAGRIRHISDFDIFRSTLCAKHYLHVLRRLRI